MTKNMKRITKIIAIILLIATSKNFAISNQEILRAMRDEIQRSIDSLYISSLPKPYYIEYLLTISNNYRTSSYLGSLVDSSSNFSAKINVTVRVGSYQLDNSNYLDFSFAMFFGGEQGEESYQSRFIPIELNYNSIRRELWLATDAAYKEVTQTYSKKLAALKNRLMKDTIPDFSKSDIHKNLDTNFTLPKISLPIFCNLTDSLSKIFTEYPNINNSLVTFEHIQNVKYYVNSEGTEFVKSELFSGIEVSGTTQSADGMLINNFYTAYSMTPDNLPEIDSLKKATKLICETLTRAQNAKPLDDSYSGPILFEGQAAAELFAQLYAPNLVAQRSLLSEQGLQNFSKYTAFQTKIGGRVLPEFLSIHSIPLQKELKRSELVGYYKIDDEGIPTQNITLVEKGYLKTLLTNRTPIKRIPSSNGNCRDDYPMFSNIEVVSDKKYSKTHRELRNKLIQLCKQRDLPYAIVIRKIMNQNLLATVFFNIANMDFKFSGDQPTLQVVEAYKIYPDGREELIRGGELKGFTTQSFKDIILVGKEPYVLNILAPSISSKFGSSFYLQSSIISPDLLFEDGEFKPVELDFPTPPKLKNPLLIRK